MERLVLAVLHSLMEKLQHVYYIQLSREAGSLIQLNKEAGLAKQFCWGALSVGEWSLLGSTLYRGTFSVGKHYLLGSTICWGALCWETLCWGALSVGEHSLLGSSL